MNANRDDVRCWPVTVDLTEQAAILGEVTGASIPLKTVESWASQGLPLPAGRDGRRRLYHRDSLVVGLVVLHLQTTLGSQSPLPLIVGRALAAKLRETPLLPLESGSRPTGPIMIDVSFGDVPVHFVIPREQFVRLAEALDARA